MSLEMIKWDDLKRVIVSSSVVVLVLVSGLAGVPASIPLVAL